MLPEVASTIVPPGARAPEASAASMIERAMRSLTEDAGLKASTFATTSTPSPTTWLIRTRGVLPIRSATVEAMRA